MIAAGNITFQFLQTPFRLRHRAAIRSWLEHCLAVHGHSAGDLAFLFTNDEEMLRFNQRHLNHDYFTDILTFPTPSATGISADIVISIDRVRDNAKTLGIKPLDELHRVIAHGVLHLTGLKDNTQEAANNMRQAEESWLSHRPPPLIKH